MGDAIGKLFVDPSILPGGLPGDAFDVCGFLQVLFLGLVYGAILSKGSNMISDGSELLLLVPSMKDIVGSVVLPILGAVPDGAIVLFSGLGPADEVAESVSVGVGALAGSTIMLLTIPWFLSIFGGRVDLVQGHAQYSKPAGMRGEDFHKLTRGFDLRNTGVEPNPSVGKNAFILVGTAFTYLLIQGPATFLGCDYQDASGCRKEGEKWWAFSGMIVAALLFCAYLRYQMSSGGNQDKVNSLIAKHVQDGAIGITGLFHGYFTQEPSEGTPLKPPGFSDICKMFFHDVDANRDGMIDSNEMKMLLAKMKLDITEAEFRELAQLDAERGTIDLPAFENVVRNCITIAAQSKANAFPLKRTASQLTKEELGGLVEEPEEEEEAEVPEDIATLPPDEQMKHVIRRSCWQMGAGTAMVLLFSDPMVSVFTSIGLRLGVPNFYVAFILAPLASNLAEVIAAYNYATKKTSKSITISFETLQGAGCMNNTFCLAIFLALVFFRDLAWEYTAETISILFVEIAIAVASMKKVPTLATACMVLSLYPISLILVWGLEKAGLN
jgi:Ca2+/Na+ antiporter